MQLTVPALNIKAMRLRLEGLAGTPLVTHRFGEHTMDEIEEKQTQTGGPTASGRKGRKPKDLNAIFLAGLHCMPGSVPVLHETEELVWAEGRFGFPSVGLKAAAVRAAGACGVKMTEARQAFLIQGELVEIHSVGNPPGPVMRRDFVRPQLGVTDLAYRPEFRVWYAEPVIHYNADVITPAHIVNLFMRAGFGVGIGSWRPEKDGQWGMFTVGQEVVEVPVDARRYNTGVRLIADSAKAVHQELVAAHANGKGKKPGRPPKDARLMEE